ncbi:DUF998 domain-containing protein [Nocardia cyriacigeorgica]|uniref:DUF998 domain-containing protein n=1 Tax=Nocardia cyriacigeorgica TaxID=135487 RepID=UPI00245768E6|nr:DUF998 domain-containing protein [Nocardia cyriacigeorgica]BDU08545.1 hypothetical protein FMUBM48_48080 [Nocardia cyriacigeorgica]
MRSAIRRDSITLIDNERTPAVTDTLGQAKPHTQGTGGQSTATRLLLACGVIAPLLNIFAVLILGALRPDYNALVVPDSNLELGPGGWMQITNYIVTGTLLIAFAVGTRQVIRTGRGTTWAPILLGIYGFTFFAIGPILPDPSLGYPPGEPEVLTVHGDIHTLLGLVQFTSLPAACFVLARRKELAGRGWYRYSVATGLLVPISYVVFALIAKLAEGGPAGLIERLAIFAGGMWVVLLALRLIRKPAPRIHIA